MTIDHILHVLRIALIVDTPVLVLAGAVRWTPKLKPARIAAALRRPHP